jgi:multidrug resistance efflux pump
MDQKEPFGFPHAQPSAPGASASGASSPVAPPQQTIARPTPLPKRPKGRWFIAMLLLGSCGYGAWHAYEAFFRYRSYGIVTGRVLQLSPPWQGELTAFHVREGDIVRQGQPLLTMDNAEMRQRLSALGDELISAQADLEAEAARLKWQAAFHLDQSTSGKARYFEMLGQFLQEQKNLEKLWSELKANEKLYQKRAVARLELERIRQDFVGQQLKLSKLQIALDEAKRHTDVGSILLAKLGDLSESLSEGGQDQLKPKLAKIESLKAERSRLEQYLSKGRMLAPSNGLIVKLHRFAGEYARAGDTLVSFLEEGSLQVTLYVPQTRLDTFQVGDVLDMVLDPYPQRLQGTISRLGDQLESAPDQIKRYYSAGQKLLPVFVQPSPETQRWMAFRVESVVKLP